jgi:hypothetical protein
MSIYLIEIINIIFIEILVLENYFTYRLLNKKAMQLRTGGLIILNRILMIKIIQMI